MTNEPSLRSVLVTGDVVADHYLYEGRSRRPGSAIRLGTTQATVAGGDASLFDLLRSVADAKRASKDQALENSVSWPATVAFGLKRKRLENAIGRGLLANGYCTMKPVPQVKKSKQEVWRIDKAPGFDSFPEPLPVEYVAQDVLGQSYDIVVLDDAGLEFRRWPSRTAWPGFLLDGTRQVPSWLVLKLSSPVARGDLWHTIVSGRTQDNESRPIREDLDLVRSRTIAIMSINDLRVEPILVSKALSWERAANDLARELRDHDRFSPLRKVRFAVITLDADGALLAEFPREGDPRFRLIFDPAKLEGDFRETLEGDVIGRQSCLTAAIVAHLAMSSEPDKVAQDLERGIQVGLCAMRRLLTEGHGKLSPNGDTSGRGFPFKKVATEILAPTHEWSFGTTTVPAKAWSRIW